MGKKKLSIVQKVKKYWLQFRQKSRVVVIRKSIEWVGIRNLSKKNIIHTSIGKLLKNIYLLYGNLLWSLRMTTLL